ncbi:uracil-DNA glycosylase family protein [Candidatus Uhrbacteria bacterium]|nr:uracil-DNA glycosylase family protein [Candidatus Uhrbacteria bacterium]
MNMSVVLWVGLSDKRTGDNVLPPLSESSPSGKIVDEAIIGLDGYEHIKENLVDFAPLDERNRMRYPTSEEMRMGAHRLMGIIERVRPSTVVILGRRAAKAVFDSFDLSHSCLSFGEFRYRSCSMGGVKYLPVHHPSFISIYRRKHKDSYLAAVREMIKSPP